MRWRLAHLPTMLVVSGVLLALAAAVGGAVAGAPGALGAAAGVTLVVTSYVLSTVVIAWAAEAKPDLVLPFGIATYISKMTLFGLVMLIVLATEWSGMVPMGWAIAAAVVVWSAAQIWWVQRFAPRPPGGGE